MQNAKKKTPVPPCNGCEVRYQNCHSYCGLYKEYRAEREEFLRPIKRRKRIIGQYNGYKNDTFGKRKKGKR